MTLNISAPLPGGFKDLVQIRSVKDYDPVSIIGVVVDFMEPMKPRFAKEGPNGPDWLMTFKLLDTALLADCGGIEGRDRKDDVIKAAALPVRFFRGERVRDTFPRIGGVGDVVLLRDIKLNMFRGERIAFSASNGGPTPFLVLPAAGIPSQAFLISVLGGQRKLAGAAGSPGQLEKLSLAEQAYIVRLKHELADAVTAVGGDTRSAPGSALNSANTSPASRHRASDNETALNTSGPPPKRPKLDSRAIPKINSQFGAKFQLIQDFRDPPNWADLCGQVIKCFPAPYGGCDLYITDYTINKRTRPYAQPDATDEDSFGGRDGDAFGYTTNGPSRSWPGPWGNMTLKLNVKEPHASYARHSLTPGDWVIAQNVKARRSPDGGYLEGDMWPDHQRPDRVQFIKLKPDSPALAGALAREETYWARQKRRPPYRTGFGGAEGGGLNFGGATTTGQKLSKEERKKMKKELRKAKAKGKNVAAVTTGADNDDPTDAAATTTTTTLTASSLNPHIRCSHTDVPVSSVREMLDLKGHRHTLLQTFASAGQLQVPFVNVRYRAQVRVVDFAPHALEDFAVRSAPEDATATNAEDEEEDIGLTYYEADDETQNHEGPPWEWSFALCLEDVISGANGTASPHRVWVHVHHAEAQFLLGNDMADPADLREDRKLLAKLREKMFLLWGTLEEEVRARQEAGDTENAKDKMEVDNAEVEGEKAKQQQRNRPFECCVQEYGIEADSEDEDGDGSADASAREQHAWEQFTPTGRPASSAPAVGVGLGWKRMYALFGTTIL